MGSGNTGDGELMSAHSEYSTELEELQAAIQSTRKRIADSLDDIQLEVEEQLDWKGWIAENPWPSVGIAFALGLYLGIR